MARTSLHVQLGALATITSAHPNLGSLSLVEASARALFVHQMIGILPDRAREIYAIPEHSHALTGLAIGYQGDSESLPEGLRERDLAQRTRKPLSEFVFGGRYGEASTIAKV